MKPSAIFILFILSFSQLLADDVHGSTRQFIFSRRVELKGVYDYWGRPQQFTLGSDHVFFTGTGEVARILFYISPAADYSAAELVKLPAASEHFEPQMLSLILRITKSNKSTKPVEPTGTSPAHD